MPIDGLFLRQMTKELQVLINGKINKINQISDFEILLVVRAYGKNYQLLISMHPEYSRIHLSNIAYDSPLQPTGFSMLLRKYVEGSVIREISQYGTDRIITFKLDGTNEIGDHVNLKMICEIMGRVSNFIITIDDKIVDCLKHQNPFEGNYRTLVPSARYLYPFETKIPYDEVSIKLLDQCLLDHTLAKEIQGISKPLNVYLENKMDGNAIKEALESFHPTLIEGKKKDFYYFDFENLIGERTTFLTLSDLLDAYYYELDKMNRIKQKSSGLVSFIHHQIEKNQNKKMKLTSDLSTAKEADKYRLYGELLLANLQTISGSKAIVQNYYTKDSIEIPLDPLLTPIENSNRYFNKYQKAKKSVFHLEEQISQTEEEITYFELLENQINSSNVLDTLEIKQELEDYGYLKPNKTQKRKKVPAFDTYKLDEATIYVGKNNVQNAYLTHVLADSFDTWFHVKDAPSSHVIVKGKLDEASIRLAANLAAYHSKYQKSSSVAVDYTQKRYIKKIPKRHNCFVTYTNQKTIYIDPDIKLIQEAKKK